MTSLPDLSPSLARSADLPTLSDRDTYRPHPPEQATTGPCQTCRFRLGDYCAEDGLKLAPGSCPHYERTPPMLSDSQRKRLHDRWRSLLSRLT